MNAADGRVSVVNLVVSNGHQDVHQLDHDLCTGILRAVNAGVPQGQIVALLQGHLHYQTQRMLDNA